MTVETLSDGTRIECEPAEEGPRIKRIIACGDFLLHKMFNGLPRPYTVMNKLLDDAEIIHIKFDVHEDRIEFIVASSSYEPWDGESEIPEHQLVFTEQYAQMRRAI